MTRRDPSPWFVFAVLFLVYIGWGSSYIGYKLSLEVAGPFLVAGGRAFIGGLLLAFMLLASGKWVRPSWKTIRWSLVVGILIGLDEVGILLIVGGKRGHEHIVGDLTRDGDGSTGRDGADERLHAPVAQGKPYGANVDSLLRKFVCSEHVSNVSAAFRGCRFVRLLLPSEHASSVHARMHSTFKRLIHP